MNSPPSVLKPSTPSSVRYSRRENQLSTVSGLVKSGTREPANQCPSGIRYGVPSAFFTHSPRRTASSQSRSSCAFGFSCGSSCLYTGICQSMSRMPFSCRRAIISSGSGQRVSLRKR